MDLDEALGIGELRAAFVEYTRRAFALLPAVAEPHILDIGCGSGAVTLELARLCSGTIVGLDVDEQALHELDRSITSRGLADRVTTRHQSLLDPGLPAASFDLLWEEGVLHMLDPQQSLAACRRLLGPASHLVMAETIEWVEGQRSTMAAAGFVIVDRLDWEPGCWWSRYYGPLEERIGRLRDRGHEPAELVGLARHEAEIEMVKGAPSKTDCCHLVVRCPGGSGPGG